MGNVALSAKQVKSDLKALNRRATAILKARPAYREMVDFYLTIFRRQVEWRDQLVVRPEEVDAEQAQQCLREGTPLSECYDPGIDLESLLNLWREMKRLFRRGNPALKQAVDKIDDAELSGEFAPAVCLLDHRSDRPALVEEVSDQVGVEPSVLATLVRAVTFPHWQMVSKSWLPSHRLDEWKRYRCPVCGGLPGLVETRTSRTSDAGDLAPAGRFAHCSFCGSCWGIPGMQCPACNSTKPGDAKYLFTSNEPELRIDFCKSCHRYVKIVDGDKISGGIHVGLELLTTAHLDVLAQDKKLSPVEVCA